MKLDLAGLSRQSGKPRLWTAQRLGMGL